MSEIREGLEVTDDVSIVEYLKHPVYVTQGSYTDINQELNKFRETNLSSIVKYGSCRAELTLGSVYFVELRIL